MVTVVDTLILTLETRFSKGVAGIKQFNSALDRATERISKVRSSLNKFRQLDELNLSMTKSGRIVDKFNRSWEVTDKELMKRMDLLKKKTQNASKGFGQLKGSIMSFGFAALFGGMALKAFSTKVITALITAFTAARDEGDFLTNKIMGVSAAFEFLKFSIFDAFANSDLFIPVIDFIINMTNAISQFIAKNPGLATFIVLMMGVGVILGSVLMVIGQIALSYLGLVGLMEMLEPILTPLLKLGLFPILIIILKIIAVLLVLWIAWKTNFGNMQSFVGETFGIIWETIKGVVGNLIEIFKGLFLIIEGLFTGDFSKIWEGVVIIVFNAISGIIKIIAGLGTAILNIFLWVVNAFQSMFLNILKIVIGAIRSLIRGINSIPGINISTGFLDKAIGGLENFKVATQIEPISDERVAQSFENLEAIKDIIIDGLTERDERLAREQAAPITVNVEGNVVGEEDMVNRVLKNIQDAQIGSTQGG